MATNNGNGHDLDLARQIMRKFGGAEVELTQGFEPALFTLNLDLGANRSKPAQTIITEQNIQEMLEAAAENAGSRRKARTYYPVVCPVVVTNGNWKIDEITSGEYEPSRDLIEEISLKHVSANSVLPIFILGKNKTRHQWFGVLISKGKQKTCWMPEDSTLGDGNFKRMLWGCRHMICIVVVTEDNWKQLKETTESDGLGMVVRKKDGKPEKVNANSGKYSISLAQEPDSVEQEPDSIELD